jgi:hypothetical protein
MPLLGEVLVQVAVVMVELLVLVAVVMVLILAGACHTTCPLRPPMVVWKQQQQQQQQTRKRNSNSSSSSSSSSRQRGVTKKGRMMEVKAPGWTGYLHGQAHLDVMAWLCATQSTGGDGCACVITHV